MSDSEDAVIYAKKHHKLLVAEICNIGKHEASTKPFTLFMAGSPGSGKTEYSKSLLKELEKMDPSQKIVRLDTDELRELLPQYSGNNSDVVQKAATLLFDKAFDHIQNKHLNAIIDTTFASPRSIGNVDRAINRDRKVGILYLHQDPLVAWEYTKKRERLEGRTVPKDVFIRAYFYAKDNVDKIKTKYGDQIELNLFEKDHKNNFVKKARFNINSLDEFIKENYTHDALEKVLSNSI
jgi:UDP-N-acetylglucosamine kinase